MSPNEKKSSHAGDPKIRTNGVYVFDTSRTIVDIQPNGEWMVSAGQPSNPPPKVTTAHDPGGNGFDVEFDAGRQGTSAVADSFDTLCGGASNEWCGHSFDSSPSELNFYFGLNLSLKSGASTAEVTVYLAQGSHEVNNWWIGGASISNNPGLLKANIGGEPVTLSIQSFGDNEFDFSLANSHS